jgi:serine/threonine protein phosphatase PrpC
MLLEIEETSRKPEIKGYKSDEYFDDYVKEITDGDTKYGLCRIMGGIPGHQRDWQQDVMTTSSRDGVAIIKDVDDFWTEVAYREAFAEIQKNYANVAEKGTTCCLVTAWLKPNPNGLHELTIWTANLGDSAAYLVLIDKDDNYATTLLNTLHGPNSEEELARLKKIKTKYDYLGKKYQLIDYVTKKRRLPTSVNVFRGFGDCDSEPWGYIHDPEIKKHIYKLPQGTTAHIIVGSDGLVERGQNFHNLGKIVHRNKGQSPGKTAETMVDAAYHEGVEGSTDNTSAGIFEVNTTPASMTVFDGHGYGAEELTPAISKIFYSTLQKYMAISKRMSQVYKTLTEDIPAREFRTKLESSDLDKEKQNQFKQQLFNEHISAPERIFKAQIALGKQAGVNLDTVRAEVAFSIVQNIQYIILNTPWKVGPFGGKRVESDGRIVAVTGHMFEMLNVIKRVYDKYKSQTPRIITNEWLTAYHEIVSIGQKAERNEPISFFCLGKRDEAPRQFYAKLVTAKDIAQIKIEESTLPESNEIKLK